MTDLKRLWQKATLSTVHNEGRPALLGRTDGTIYWVDDEGATRQDEVWVRYVNANGTLTEVHVRNSGLPATPGLPVLLVDRHGVLTAIIDQFGLRMRNFTGGGGWLPLPQHGFTHRIKGIDPRYVEGLAMEPLLVKPSKPAAMTVQILPGWYNWNGNEDVWEGGDTGSLSSYVPGAAGTIHFVIIAIDSSTNTSLIIDGDDVAAEDVYGVAAVGYSDIEAIAIAENYIPLAVVELINGQTTIKSSDITHDLRRWMAKGGSGGFALDVDSILVDSNGDVLSDSNGNVLVESA